MAIIEVVDTVNIVASGSPSPLSLLPRGMVEAPMVHGY